MTAVDDLRELVAEMAGRIGDLEGENADLRGRVTTLEGELRGAAEWAAEQREREGCVNGCDVPPGWQQVAPDPERVRQGEIWTPPDDVVWRSPE
jgi:hypothetical protein